MLKLMTAKRTPPGPFRFSREQYFRLGELGFFHGKRVERIHGEIVEMSPIGWPHVVSTTKTSRLLEKLFAGIGWINQGNPIPTEDSDPQPDVMAVPGCIEDYTDHPTTALLIVEVADTTLSRDTTVKAELYATANVPEYWVIDLEHRLLLVYRDPEPLPEGLGATAYRTRLTLTESDVVTPIAVPTASVKVAELLP
jgi:Uma2 family endonuclease